MSAIQDARSNAIQGLGRISHFWGFPKAMGAIFGALYLSPDPLSLDNLAATVGVSKGAVSTNVRHLERLGLVHKHLRLGDRKDFYLAETDFWKIVKGILKEREKSEFNRAIEAVGESLEMLNSPDVTPDEKKLADFYRTRLQTLADFFKALDNLVATVIALDELRAGALERLFKTKR